MEERSTPISLATSTRSHRTALGAMLLIAAIAHGRAAGTALVDDDPASRLDPMGLAAAADDIKAPTGGTDDPPGDLPAIIVDNPANDDDRR